MTFLEAHHFQTAHRGTGRSLHGGGYISPSALKKAGTKRFWKRFEEVRLERFSQKESHDLLEKKIDRYSVTADDMEVYKRKVLALSQGSPYEIDRLVKYHSSQSIVRTGELANYTQSFVEG